MAIYAIRQYKMLDGTPPLIQQWTVTAGQTFKVGEPLTRVAGLAVVCGADPALIGAISLQAVTACAAGTVIDVIIPTDMTVFLMCVQGTGALNAIQVADMGDVWDIEADTGVWQVDKDSNTRDQVQIYEFIDPVGTVNGRVGVIFRRVGTGYAREF